MMGINANTVVPNGDTIAGLKYIARRFVGDVARAEGLRYRSLPVAAGDAAPARPATVNELRRVRKTRAARLGGADVPDTDRPHPHPGRDDRRARAARD